MRLRQQITLGLFGTALFFSPIAFADTSVPANNENFSSAQVKSIENIVHAYLVNNPQVLVEAAQALQKQQQTTWQNTANKVIPQISEQLFNSITSPVVGNKNGKITLVEFLDYQCSNCKEMSAEVKDVLRKDKDLRVILKSLPIFGGNSEFAAKAAIAADKQGKFLALHEALLGTTGRLTPEIVLKLAEKVGLNTTQLQKDMQNAEIDQEIKNNYQLAKKLNLVGTPAFVIAQTTVDAKTQKITDFENSVIIPGAVDENSLIEVIAQVQNGEAQSSNA